MERKMLTTPNIFVAPPPPAAAELVACSHYTLTPECARRFAAMCDWMFATDAWSLFVCDVGLDYARPLSVL